MSEWTCEQVEGQIDLYAAGEADGPTRAAVGRHLAECTACAESHQQAQQLLGLLDQQFQESERLQRLWSRLEAAPKRARRPVRLVLWRAAAIAASVLATLGLSGWLGPGAPSPSGSVQVAAVLNPPPTRFVPGAIEAMAAPKAVDAAGSVVQQAVIPEYPLDLGGRTPAEFWRAVGAAAGTDRLPPPPAVNFTLEIHNPGRGVLPLRFGDERTELILSLQGPGVLDAPAPGAAPPLADLGDVRIAPGATLSIPIRKLSYGRRGAVHYLYWTEPGEYNLSVTLRAAVETDPLAGVREISPTAGPFTIRVGRQP